jgi:hypothetical protein
MHIAASLLLEGCSVAALLDGELNFLSSFTPVNNYFFVSSKWNLIITSSNEDDNDDLLSLAEDSCIVSALLACRTVRITKSRLSWSIYIQMLLHENQFHVMYRMTFDSFNYLLQLLSPRLNVNERFARMSSGAPIYLNICYLAPSDSLPVDHTMTSDRHAAYPNHLFIA